MPAESRSTVLQALIDAICLDCQLTHEQLYAVLSDPGFGATGRGRDWRAFVPAAAIEAWEALSPDAQVVLFYAAFLQGRDTFYAVQH